MPNSSLLIELLLILLGSIALTILAKWLINFLSQRLKKFTDGTNTKWDDISLHFLTQTRSWFLFVWFLALILQSSHKIQLNDNFAKLPVVFVSGLQLIIWAFTFITDWKKSNWAKRDKMSASSLETLGLLYTSLKVFVVILVLLIALSNLGVNVGAVIAGLGIGGVAVALAAQNILGDLLSSLAIVLDKPFAVGDYIVVGNEEGEVEDIGIKTTRVRSISGEELIFSNKDLLESRIRNFKRMWRRRVSHSFLISLDTPVRLLEQLPNSIAQIFQSDKKLTFDRCHISAVKDNAYEIQLVFWIEDSAHTVYMNLQQEILLAIFTQLKSLDVKLSVPVRKVEIISAADFHDNVGKAPT